MKVSKLGAVAAALMVTAILALPPVLTAQEEAPAQVLFTNVNVWDGTSDGLQNGVDVLVTGNLITQVAGDISPPSGATVIDGGGRTLIPGLIDMHSHLSIMEGMLDGRDAFDQMAIGAMTGMRSDCEITSTIWGLTSTGSPT